MCQHYTGNEARVISYKAQVVGEEISTYHTDKGHKGLALGRGEGGTMQMTSLISLLLI